MNLVELLQLGPPFGSTQSVPDSSVHERCLAAVRTRLRSLALPGLAPDNIVVQKLPWARDFLGNPGLYGLPGIIVSPFGSEQMDPLQGTNLKDLVAYPVFVSIVAADNQQLTENLGRYLLWRERVARAFRNQPLAGVVEITNCYIEPGPIVLPEAFVRGLYHSGVMIRCVSREPRG